ncbi:hypothetical protein ENSA5_03850 [Enhygromyxa salina]|uniref:Uncharacterized protein n=1 Tax=Enhygromyxa salina TaxID=215803 RepID=A0A2S9YJQ4_9BACT|nr:hypothetical protein [Enhygromyxa salina]PRQ05266.1 hypothetical protein ENSA5_03850 [Enhygromyxa salina]
MSVLGSSRLGFVLVAAACVTATGCKKSGEGATSPDVEVAEVAEASSQDPLAELDALEGRMVELGLPVARAKAAAEPPAEASPDDAFVTEGEAEGADLPVGEPGPAGVATDASVAQAPRRDEGDRCMDLCGLSESICELEVRICTLSESHAGDPIYADACERAVDDCATAGDACDRCES